MRLYIHLSLWLLVILINHNVSGFLLLDILNPFIKTFRELSSQKSTYNYEKEFSIKENELCPNSTEKMRLMEERGKKLKMIINFSTDELSRDEKFICTDFINAAESFINQSINEGCKQVSVTNKLLFFFEDVCYRAQTGIKQVVLTAKDAMKDQKQLTVECIEAIKGRNCQRVVRKLDLINENNIKALATHAYNISKNEYFFDVVRCFSLNNNVNKLYIAYDEFYRLIKGSNDSNQWNLFHLYIAQRKFVIRNSINSCNMNSLNNKLEEHFTEYLTEELFINYKDHHAGKQVAESDLAGHLYLYSNHLYNNSFNALIKMLKNNISQFSPTKIMQFATKSTYVSKVLIGLEAVYSGSFTGPEKLLFTCYLHQIDQIKNLQIAQRQLLVDLIEKIPKAIYHFYFSKYLCIKNKEYDVYLVTEKKCENCNATFIYADKKKAGNSIWYVERIGENICENNKVRLRNYASYKVLLSRKKRTVSKHINTLRTAVEKFQWYIEPANQQDQQEDYQFYIRNVADGTYLFINNKDFMDHGLSDKHKLMEHITKQTSGGFLWTVEKCSINQTELLVTDY